MAITAKAVKALRDRTGAGMMDCKKALVENDGDVDKAAEYLQIKGIAKAAKKADRVAAEGLVGTAISADGKTAAVVEVNCETDFVARNEEFQTFVQDITDLAAAEGISSVEALSNASLGDLTVEESRKVRIANIGENISIRRVSSHTLEGEGVLGTYVHGGGSRGAVVVLSADTAPTGDAAKDLGRDLAMHVAATNPRFTHSGQIDAETVAQEERILTEQAMESGKPREIAEKMVIGRLKKWKKEICFVDQPFVKNPDVSVEQEVARVSKDVGATLSVASFTLFVRGEGIEKKESNLAEEVAAQLR